MTETELKSDIVIRNELLTEAHEIICAILLRGALQLDIKPVEPLGQRIRNFNVTLRTMGLVGSDQQSTESP